MKIAIGIGVVLSTISATYLMTAHLLGENFTYSWQVSCMQIILVVSLMFSFIMRVIEWAEVKPQ